NRAVYLGENSFCLMTDTVGLLYHLPHHLIAAFKATLEEAVFADLLLCVYDASSLHLDRQRRTTAEVISMLDLGDKPSLEVFNKIDAIGPEEHSVLAGNYPQGIFISARSGEGLEELRQKIREQLVSITRKAVPCFRCSGRSPDEQ
ncbi:MAG TPA: GTPase HflX, partial [bacterium]|nr:GTPase HflX [bacterium]